jgi:hypothetical protein
VGGTLEVTGATTTNDITNTGALTSTGATTLTGATNINTTGTAATTIGNSTAGTVASMTGGASSMTVNNTSATVANGGNTVAVSSGGTAITHGDSGNSVTVGATQSTTVGLNTVDYGTSVNGGMLVTGDLGVNGNIYSLNPTANATVNIANNGLNITGATNTVSLIADSNAIESDGRGQLTLQENQVSLTVVNPTTHQAHGLFVGTDRTVLSGGTTSTTLTLDDGGATFQNTSTGGPAKVTGVADGTSTYDAVNYRQLRKAQEKAHAGIAAASALAAVPSPMPGKRFAIGAGWGHFQGENALAIGLKMQIWDSINASAGVGIGVGQSEATCTANTGFSYSF